MPPPDASPTLPPPARAITWRSVLFGLLGVVFINTFTPYNDYALNNTFLVGNNLPLGVVMGLFAFAFLINGPLSRFAPRLAFTSGEITIAFSMTLVSCALPSSGLMRYFPTQLVTPYWLARGNPDYRQLLSQLNLPDWLLVTFPSDALADRMNSPIVTGFIGRWTAEGGYPYAAWLRPALAWGIFFAALFGAMFCMVALVRRQWFENERLPFPLAQIYLPLVTQPRPGHWLNDILRQRPFWIAFAGVFLLHLWNGLHQYSPAHFPQIPVSYSLPDLFSEIPWAYVDWKVKDAAVFFTVVGVTYFLTTPVAFSLWGFFILHQFYRIYLGYSTGGDTNPHGQADQHLGGLIAFTLAVLWIGRRHWRLIIAQSFRGPRPDEPQGRYMPYSVGFWGLIACHGAMIVWFVAAGATIWVSLTTITLLMMGFFIITRIIAETGLVHGQLQLPLDRPWTMLGEYGFPHVIPLQSEFLTRMLHTTFYDFREVQSVYAAHAMKVADQTIYDDRQVSRGDRQTGWKLIALMALAMTVGYFVSFGSTLHTEYTYSSSRDVLAVTPINTWGAESNVNWQLMGATDQYRQGNYNARHSPVGHMTFGFLFTAALSWMRLRFTWWPLHPIGYLMLGTFPGAYLWFSIFWGWLAKVLIVRFGGAKMYVSAKPFFLGLIVGESMAAGFWLVMGLAMSALNLPYSPVLIMPG